MRVALSLLLGFLAGVALTLSLAHQVRPESRGRVALSNRNQVVRCYDVRDLLSSPLVPSDPDYRTWDDVKYPNFFQTLESERSANLVRLIENNIENTVSRGAIDVVAGRLLVKQTPQNLLRVEELLRVVREASAPPSTRPAAVSSVYAVPSAEVLAEAELIRPRGSLDFDDLSFRAALEFISKRTRCCIRLDDAVFEDRNFSAAAPVSLHLHDGCAVDAIDTILAQAIGLIRLGYTVNDGTVTITTLGAARKETVIRAYDVSALRLSGNQDRQLLFDKISAGTDPHADERCELSEANGWLLVKNTWPNQRRIVRILEKM